MELEQIGKYKIVGKIGEGAMGVVYKALDPVLNRYVAIKTISASLDADDDLRKRFRREAQSAGQLNHPNIITVYDFGEEQGKIYMAMELLEGHDLKEIISSRKPLSVDQKLRFMEQICDGLAFAHSREIVHRDLKPSNLHIQPNGQVKIMDFGLARLTSSEMTRTGLVMGTPNYMSPEQIQGQRVDSRSDIFSLGAVFYELLCYRKPFTAESMHAIMFKVLQSEPEPLRDWLPELPESLVQVVEKALSKEPAQRFQDASELREALRAVRKSLVGVGDWTMLSQDVGPLQAVPAPEDPTRVQSRPAASLPAARLSQRPAPRVERTERGRALEPPRAKSLGRPAVYVGGVGLLAAAVAAVIFLARSPSPPEGGSGKDVVTQQISALTQALVGSQLELARKDFDYKNYPSAVTQAERVLQLDPENREARQILEQARGILSDLERAVTEARAALKAGQTEQAARALAKVLSIDPAHPLAAELSNQLDSHFRGRAEEARRSMLRSRQGAESARASSLEPFAEANRLAREGEERFKREEFALAAQKFLGSGQRFDQARRAGEERAAAQKAVAAAKAELDQLARQWSQLRDEARSNSAGRQLSFQKALGLEAQAQQLAEKGDFSGARVAYHEAIAKIGEARQEALKEKKTQESEQAPGEERATPEGLPPVRETLPPPPPRSPVAVANEEPAVRKVIADYERAIESKDLALFKAVKPNLSREEERRLQASFQAVQSQQVEITIASVDFRGSQAEVRLARRDTLTFNGKQQTTQTQQTILLVKGAVGWTITQIGQ